MFFFVFIIHCHTWKLWFNNSPASVGRVSLWGLSWLDLHRRLGTRTPNGEPIQDQFSLPLDGKVRWTFVISTLSHFFIFSFPCQRNHWTFCLCRWTSLIRRLTETIGQIRSGGVSTRRGSIQYMVSDELKGHKKKNLSQSETWPFNIISNQVLRVRTTGPQMPLTLKKYTYIYIFFLNVS